LGSIWVLLFGLQNLPGPGELQSVSRSSVAKLF
jgi:hypothetical protein